MRSKRNPPDAAGESSGQRGAALLMVLVAMVILGLTAGIAGQSWRSVVQRAKEDELLWRGQQYRSAIESYFQTRQGVRNMFPRKLQDLVSDNRFPEPARHLRRLYDDPMTGEEWAIIKAPDGGIAGVRSTSNLRPFRQEGFPEGLESLANGDRYRDWEFVYTPARTGARQAGPAAGTPGSPVLPGDSALPVNPNLPADPNAPGRRPAPDPTDVLPRNN